MRRHQVLLVLLAAVIEVGCVSQRTAGNAQKLCTNADPAWQLLPEPPRNHPELLALPAGDDRLVREVLSAPVRTREVWFSRGADRLMVCHYQEHPTHCPAMTSAEFVRRDGTWEAGAVLGTVCIDID
jgi:hypothetical protein